MTVTYSQNAAGIDIPWESKEPAKGLWSHAPGGTGGRSDV